jgi:hypothetical protein
MTLRGSGFWSVAILLSAATPVLAQTPPPQTGNPPRMVLDRVVASVNDEALTLSEVQEEGQPVIRKIFQDFVGAERERRVEGLTLDQVRRTISERLAIGRLLARQVRSSIILGEEELAKYYEANPEKFRRVPEAQIHHALFSVGSGEGEAKVKARVEEAGAKIRAGADFGATAGQYGADAVASGADVLTVHRGELAPEIEAVAFSLPVGEISAPIRTDVGYHLIRVEKVRAEPVAPFAEVRELIRDQLLQEKFEARRKDYIAGLRARASIQVFLKEGEILGIPGGARESEAVTRRSP